MLPSINVEAFCDHYNTVLSPILGKFEGSNFSLTVVGGSVRDFIQSNKLSSDVDIEITYNGEGDFEKEWLEFVSENFNERLSKFHVLKVDINNISAELAPARIETFNDNNTHDNFEAIYISGENRDQSFKRRDFTINAIGISLTDEKVIDPFSGTKDIENKILRNITSDFFLDPVRLLRLIRFSVLFDYTIANDIINNLGLFNLSGLSSHYFSLEYKKSGYNFKFIQRLFAYIRANNISFPVELPDITVDNRITLYYAILNETQLKYFQLDVNLYRLMHEYWNLVIKSDEDSFEVYKVLSKIKKKSINFFEQINMFEHDKDKLNIFNICQKTDKFNTDNVSNALRSRFIFDQLFNKYVKNC